MLLYELKMIVKRKIALSIPTYSNSKFLVIFKDMVTTKIVLMVNVRPTREAYQKNGDNNYLG